MGVNRKTQLSRMTFVSLLRLAKGFGKPLPPMPEHVYERRLVLIQFILEQEGEA